MNMAEGLAPDICKEIVIKQVFVFKNCLHIPRTCQRCRKTGGLRAWTVRADVPLCFHIASTAWSVTGTAVSRKNGERFTLNAHRFLESAQRLTIRQPIPQPSQLPWKVCGGKVEGPIPAIAFVYWACGTWRLFFENHFQEKWRVDSSDLLHINTFSKNNNSCSRVRDSCSHVRDSCSGEKVVQLFQKWYDFFLGTAISLLY